MKSLLLLLIVSLISFEEALTKVYYVAPSGNNANSGLSTSSAWQTLTYAAGSSSPVTAGDTVYVKAGSYTENVVFAKSGSAGKPITFQGYKTTPGDAPPLVVNNSNPFASFVTTDMPTYNGGNRATGVGFNCQNQAYLVFRNFQILNYAYGFIAGGASQSSGNLVLYNVNTMNTGDINASYSGEGFLFGSMGSKFSNGNVLTNCQVVNSSAEGFGINGDNNNLANCKVYCNDSVANGPTDYYIIITGNYNVLTNCYIERKPGLSHAGHGYSCKTNAEQVVDQGLSLPVITAQYNKFYYCVAKNMGESFCVRHRLAQYNTFYHCKAIGTHTGASGSPGGEGCCMVTRDGASNNTFNGCIAENCRAGIEFEDTVEDGDTGSNPTGHPGNNNVYYNCQIYNCYMGIYFSSYSIQSDAGNNTIANCTFYKTRYIYEVDRHATQMKYIGNIYDGCLPATTGGSFNGGTYQSDVLPNGANTYFHNCDFINIEGGMPSNFVASSTGSIAKDPLFTNSSALDFHLQSNSPCINTSANVSFVSIDFDSLSRLQKSNYDIGAFEYLNSIPLSVTTSLKNVTCNGGKDGSASVTANGGKNPYTYAWVNGNTTATCTGLSAGNYSVTVVDNAGTTATATVVISQPAAVATPTASSNGAVCAGDTLSLTATTIAGANYAWKGPNGFSSSSQNPTLTNVTAAANGTYSVHVTVNGCTGSDGTTSVTINQSPAVPVTGSNGPLCTGTTLSLTASAITGATYSWNGPNGFSSSTENPTISNVTTINAGTYSVIATVNGCTSSAGTLNVTISAPLAAPTAGSNSPVSAGKTLSLTASTIAGATYAWNGPNSFSSSSQNPVLTNVTTAAAGVYSVTATDTAGCKSATGEVTVSVHSRHWFSITTSITNVLCNGNNDGTAAVTSVQGTQQTYKYDYTWNTTPVQHTSKAVNLQAGTYSVIVSDSIGNSDTASVVIAEPSALNYIISSSNSSGSSGGTANISVSGGTSPYAYSWNTTPVSTTPSISGLLPGTYSVVVTDKNACSVTASVTINGTATGIFENNTPDDASDLNVFPNPATSQFSIVSESIHEGSSILVVLYDTKGNEVYSKVVTKDGQTAIDTEGRLSPGVYVVVATSDDRLYRKKIIIEGPCCR